MAIWPFRRRRRAHTVDAASSAVKNVPEDEASVLRDAQLAPTSAPIATPASPSAANTSFVTRRSSRRASNARRRRASLQSRPTPASPPPQWQSAEEKQDIADKENVAPRAVTSRENITALPISYQLQQSPHLRPVDLERPRIPYNFRTLSTSQTSVQGQEHTKSPRSQTLHSRRSANDYTAPTRRASSRLSRRRDDAVREEEIRAMSAPIPIPKRAGDGPLRRESKKVRDLGGRDSQVSLPPEGSVHSSMSGVMEQRGWEVGSLAVFNPRPAVRLSGTPQYVLSTSLPQSPSGVLYRIDSIRAKDKAPVTTEPARKKRIIGDEVDELDSSDIRAIMERDAKRREKRREELHEKLERRLKSREGRNRGDSDARRRVMDETQRAGDDRMRAEQQIQAHGPLTPPTDVHPALRIVPEADAAGLGIGSRELEPADLMEVDDEDKQFTDAAQEQKDTAPPANPFTDAANVHDVSPMSEQAPNNTSGVSLPYETPMEEPFLGTAQAIHLAHTHTPPLSPTYAGKATTSTSQLTEALQQKSAAASGASDLPPPPPPRIPVERRSSDPPQEKRAGAWATFFRRGGTTLRKTGRDATASPSPGSFSNTSRESMRNRPPPAHLVGAAERPPAVRSKSGTPVRTQSKFREDLPEMPISPAGSQVQSPDVTTAAAAAAIARRTGRTTPQPVDISGRVRHQDRSDTPLSQSVRGHHAMAGSLASIDSEGEWLAGMSTKRQSNQSALSRSLSKRNEFNASYEELAGDGDAEYMTRNRSRKLSNPTQMGASPDEESEEDGEATAGGVGALPTVHGSVRRRPTLVERDPRLKSREGLVTEYAAGEPIETPYAVSPEESPERTNTDDEDDEDEPESQIERATSVTYASRHSRQFSAGSARLLDMPVKRPSLDRTRENSTPTTERPTTSGAYPDP